MPQLVPVDHDPFAQTGSGKGPVLVPVDNDPFAGQAPSGHSFDLMLSPEEKAAVEAQNRAILQTPEERGRAASQQNPMVSGLLAAGGGVVEGTPVIGSYLRDGGERLAAGTQTLWRGGSFDDNLGAVQAAGQQAKKDHPYLDAAGQVAGGVNGTIPMMAAAPAAFGAGNGSLLARTLMSGATGASLGGADAAMRSKGDPVSMLLGAGSGGAFGLLGPTAGQLIGRGMNNLVQRYKNSTAPVPGMGNAAANLAAEDFTNAGGRGAITNRMQELGPEAMLLDASPSHLGSAQGLGVRPETREIITNPLTARNDATNARLRADVDANIGPDPIPSQVEAGLKASRDALHPEYRRVLSGSGPVDTATLAKSLDDAAMVERGPAQKAIREVRKMLNEVPDPNAPSPPAGTPPVGPSLDTNASTLLNTRHAIDGMMKTEADTNVIRVLTDARKSIDAELAAKVPGIKDVDAQFQELAKQSEGLERGAQVLGTGKTAIRPQELAQELTAAAQPKGTMIGPSAEPLRIQQGAAGDIHRAIGTKANDLVALKQYVMAEGDWNPQKLAQIFGPDEAKNIINAVDREVAFRNAYNKVVENSQTAMRSASADRFAVRGEGPASADGGLGIPLAGAVAGPQGAALAAGAKVGAKAVSKAATLIGAADDVARNQQLARALILQGGPDLDVVLNALQRRAGLAGAGDKAGQVTDRLVNALLQSQGGRAGQEVPRLLGY